MVGRYRYSTYYTIPGEHLFTLYKTFSFAKDMTNIAKGVVMMQKVHNFLAYQPGSTNIETTAEQAMALGCGVCQDYSHILDRKSVV